MAAPRQKSGQRCRWVPAVEKCGGEFRLVIMYKDARGNIVPFSKSPKNASVKFPWGPPDSCSTGVEDRDGIQEPYLRFGRGGGDFQKLYLSSLSIAAVGVTPFTQQIQSLITRSKTELLGLLLSTLQTAEGFCQHHSELHSSEGLRLDHKGVSEKDLESSGGNLEELKVFVENAKISAVKIVDEVNPLKRYLSSSTGDKLAKRKVRPDRESNFHVEVRDKDGVEKKYSSAFCGSLDIKLGSLEVDPVLKTKIRYFHVDGLKNAMLSRFDPSLLSIVVRPADVEKYDENHPELSKYYVIQGLHSFRALQLLMKEGKLDRLPGMKHGFVTVTLVNVDDSELLLYGHLRGNALASTFIRKPQPQDLLKIYGSLISQKKQARKLVERIARLQRLGPVETKAVLDLCSWQDEQFQELLEVVEKYECYETGDTREKVKSTIHVSQVKMSKGELMTMPNKILAKLSKVNPEYFMKVSDSIKSGSTSLRAVLDMYEKDKERHKVLLQIEAISGKSFQTLKSSFRDHFSQASIDTFIGATEKNDKGNQLKIYVKEVLAGGKALEKAIVIEDVKHIEEIVKVSDILVVKCGEIGDRKVEWLDQVCNPDLTTILLFHSEQDQLDALCYLRTNDDIRTQQLFFDKEPKELHPDDDSNIQLCVVTGKSENVQGKVKMYSGNLQNIKSVVGQLSSPGCRVSSVSDQSLDLIPVHSENIVGRVTYYGSQEQLTKVSMKILKEGYTITDMTMGVKKVSEKEDEETVHQEETVCEEIKVQSEQKALSGQNQNTLEDDRFTFNDTDHISQFDTHQFKSIKDVACCECSEKFCDPQDLEKHYIEKHSDYECVQCGEKFTSKEKINQHKKSVHENVFKGLAGEESSLLEGLDSTSLLASQDSGLYPGMKGAVSNAAGAEISDSEEST